MNIIPGEIRIKRGLKADLPVLDPWEPAYCTDTKEYFIGTPDGNVLVGSQAAAGDTGYIQEQIDTVKVDVENLKLNGTGQPGADGKSAYQIWLDQGNAGTITDFLASLKGAKGDPGTGSGGGILIYETLSELQSAYPDGLNQPVWINEDNSWYHWEGTVTQPSDTTAPVLTITAGGTFTGTKTVSMSVDETADIFYTLDGSTPTTASTKYTAPLSVSATTTLKAFARDSAGNVSEVQSVTYTLDSTPPADTTAPDNVTNLQATPSANSVALSWTASVSSDVASYDVYNGSTLVANVTGTSYNVTNLNASTQYTFSVRAKDGANNVASGTSVTTTTLAPADTTAPVLTMTTAQTFTDSMTVNMSANETATIWYTIDDSDPITSGTRLQYTAPITITETDTFKAYAVDTAGNASTVQTVTYTKETVTYSDYALSFSGVAGSNATSTNSMNITGAGARTIEVRFKCTTVPTGNNGRAIVGWGDMSVSNALSSIIVYEGSPLFYTKQQTVFATTDLVADTWYHFVATYNGSTAVVYLNGVQEKSQSVGALATKSTPLTFAIDGGDTVFQNFNGQIDYVRVYNTALTATDVTNNYNGTVQRTGLVHEWLIKEGTGTTTSDEVSGNTINTSNATWVGI